MKYSTRQTIWNISVLVSLLLVILGCAWLFIHHEQEVEDLQAACRAAGGRVEVLHGDNHGAWICLGEDEGHDI